MINVGGIILRNVQTWITNPQKYPRNIVELTLVQYQAPCPSKKKMAVTG